MPLYEALAFVKQTLDEFNLSKHIKILGAGKIITGFDILKALSMGASACYSGRGMMFAIGCIQALICDTDRCPAGVATQNPKLYKGLDPKDKAVRVFNFHLNTIKATKEMMEACGFNDVETIPPSRFYRKMDEAVTRSFEDIYRRSKTYNNNKKSTFESSLN